MRLPRFGRSPAPAPTIFISYRRDDSSGHAGRLYDSLRDRWGEDCVRMDVGDIPPGVDYARAAREMVGGSDVVLVLIGRRWADGINRERLTKEDDLLRVEVETALQRNVHIIPVLLNGAPVPEREALPASLVPLLGRNAFELSDRRWAHDIKDLVAAIERLTRRTARGREVAATPAGHGSGLHVPLGIVAVLLVGALAAGLGVNKLLQKDRDDPREAVPDSGAVADTANTDTVDTPAPAATVGPAQGQQDTGDVPAGPAVTDTPTAWLDSALSAIPMVFAEEWTLAPLGASRSQTLAPLRDIRVGTNMGFDRVVFDFGDAAVPSWDIQYIEDPLRTCGAAKPVDLDGEGALRIRMSPAQAHDARGVRTVVADRRPENMPVLRELKLICDFSGVVEVVLGVGARNHFRITEVSQPSRLIVDVRH